MIDCGNLMSTVLSDHEGTSSAVVTCSVVTCSRVFTCAAAASVQDHGHGPQGRYESIDTIWLIVGTAVTWDIARPFGDEHHCDISLEPVAFLRGPAAAAMRWLADEAVRLSSSTASGALLGYLLVLLWCFLKGGVGELCNNALVVW
jgi:hypothetical protein